MVYIIVLSQCYFPMLTVEALPMPCPNSVTSCPASLAVFAVTSPEAPAPDTVMVSIDSPDGMGGHVSYFLIISSSKNAINRDWEPLFIHAILVPRIRPTRVGGFLCAQFDLDLFALSGGRGNDGYEVLERDKYGGLVSQIDC